MINPSILSLKPVPQASPAGTVFFIGTATTLIRYRGYSILTDPNFLHAGDHVHLGYGLTSKRLTNPALDIDALPPVNLCLLSHMHGDHWDRIAATRLPKDLPVISTIQAKFVLEKQGFTRAYALNTWDSIQVGCDAGCLRVTAMPGRHGPPVVAGLLPSVMGSLLEIERGEGQKPFRLYISGDTLVIDELQDIHRRYPEIDLALLHLGGTRVLRVLVTMDAEQGIRAINIVQPRMSIPIHYNDYTVFKSPLEDFKAAVKKAGLQDRVHYLAHGETYTFLPG